MLKLHKLRHNLFRIALIAGLGLTLIGCSQVIETQERPVSPTEGEATEMSQPLPTSSNFISQSLIEGAKDDLALRLSIPINQISLIEATEVEWSDSSMDCPQPGMEYLQVITPGYRILLGFSGNVYEYHSNRDTYVIYCENPDSLTLPKP